MHWLLRSRLGVVLVFGVLLLALDVGRSIWARVGLARSSAEYRPDPAQYADLTWPPGADLEHLITEWLAAKSAAESTTTSSSTPMRPLGLFSRIIAASG